MGKVLVFIPETSKHLGLFDDLLDDPTIDLFVAGLKENVNCIGKVIKRIHLSKKINSFVTLPKKEIWNTLYDVRNTQYDNALVVDGALRYIDTEIWSLLRKVVKGRICLLMINSLRADSPTIKKSIPKVFSFDWDEVFSFDPEDCKQYGFSPGMFCYYSKHNESSIPENGETSDLYYIGGLKGGRSDAVLGVFQALNKEQVVCNFQVFTYGKHVDKYIEGIRYIDAGWIPYSEVLSNVLSSNCILEILQQGQTGSSLRYFEAVCYGKKLLTNNPNIINYPFYDARYMKTFSEINDVDIDWIKKRETIDYRYKEEFSPRRFIDKYMR